MRIAVLLVFLSAFQSAMADDWYRPPLGVTWHWQLQGELNTSYPVTLYGFDLFDQSKDTIAALQRKGHKVICYFSAGSYEDWRSDRQLLPAHAIGKALDGWPGEAWLDIRDKQVWRIMQNRLKLAAEKGCDGVDPDNVDGYSNNSGFPLTAQDQVRFNRFLAQSAHILGLSIGLKNALNLIPELVDEFDFAVNEQCFEYQECELLTPFIAQQKPVLNAEYQARWVNSREERTKLCQASAKLKFTTLVLPLALDDEFRLTCP